MTDNMCQAVPEKASIIDLFPEFVDDDRKKIIEELIKQNDPELRRVSRACSFFVWLADFSCLEKLKAMPPEERKESLQKMEILKNFNLPDAFKSDECSQGLLDRGALVRRLSQVAKEALARDDNRCVVTKVSLCVNFARITPFKLNGTTLPRDIWDVLWVFWGDKVAKWQDALGVQLNDPRITTEKVSNMLSLSANIHGGWEQSWFAFRPISVNEEKTSMEIKVHWIAIDKEDDQLGNSTDEIELIQAPRPFLDEDFLRKRDSRIKGTGQWHPKKKRPLEDGEVITVTTDDPVKRPLPSMELLELQWILTRIAAMQGQV